MSLATKFPRITPVGNATNSKLHSSNKTKENCFSLPIPNTFSMPYCESLFDIFTLNIEYIITIQALILRHLQ